MDSDLKLNNIVLKFQQDSNLLPVTATFEELRNLFTGSIDLIRKKFCECVDAKEVDILLKEGENNELLRNPVACAVARITELFTLKTLSSFNGVICDNKGRYEEEFIFEVFNSNFSLFDLETVIEYFICRTFYKEYDGPPDILEIDYVLPSVNGMLIKQYLLKK